MIISYNINCNTNNRNWSRNMYKKFKKEINLTIFIYFYDIMFPVREIPLVFLIFFPSPKCLLQTKLKLHFLFQSLRNSMLFFWHTLIQCTNWYWSGSDFVLVFFAGARAKMDRVGDVPWAPRFVEPRIARS